MKKWVVKAMKTRELENIRGNDVSSLKTKVEELKHELFNLRFQLATGQLDNPMRIKEVKKSIAQVKTIIMEKELKSFGA
ncbi:50S ribosomal protein L29 [Oxobacter pfennigii]|uniref:Large ribosomal subunit protein uL29 n=2 Tax=Oxobacter pfennigii TaxID=36849 RepID=A0A0P8YSH3_9CLOT|nr:50S ribosomal protein L29 [Oxobacter pfennigii]